MCYRLLRTFALGRELGRVDIGQVTSARKKAASDRKNISLFIFGRRAWNFRVHAQRDFA